MDTPMTLKTFVAAAVSAAALATSGAALAAAKTIDLPAEWQATQAACALA